MAGDGGRVRGRTGGPPVTELEIEPRPGWVEAELEQELPGLGVLQATVSARPRRSPRGVRVRLWTLSNRFTGARAVAFRQQPVPAAYRALFRQIGLDPDERRPPAEEAVLERMRRGGFRSRGLPADALLVATVETGVAMLVLDADRLEGDVGLRLARRRERLGGPEAPVVRAGQVLVADAARPLGLLFGELADDEEVGASTERMTLLAIRVKGVPKVIAEEALWIAAELLAAED
jgi:DNA/RNA-binding domain of Phe-tRNA-synthetase-like protein